MATLRLKLVADKPRDGQAVQPVVIDGLDSGGGTTITTVEVTTLNAGEEATGSIDGSTLKLGIPRGEKGDQGEKGETGETGAAGATGAKGDKGDKGDKGETGATGVAGAKGDQGDPGVGVQSITLTTSSGAVTGGTWKDTSGSYHSITMSSSD